MGMEILYGEIIDRTLCFGRKLLPIFFEASVCIHRRLIQIYDSIVKHSISIVALDCFVY